MRCVQLRYWAAQLLGLSALLWVGNGLAEKPAASDTENAWRIGTKLTPSRPETYRLGAGTSVTLEANAVAEVQPKLKLPRTLDGLSPAAFAAQLTHGRIDIAINPKQRPASAVFIYGPRRATVLAVTGRVSVVAGPSGFAVGVYEGQNAASVGIGSTWRHLSAGTSLSISTRVPQGILSKLPAAPTHVGVSRPVLAIDGDDSGARASWDPVPGAQRYSIDLVNLKTHSRKTQETRETSLALRGLEAGRHELRVSAIDATGLNGQASNPIVVNAVGLELPPGAYVSKGRVFLAPHQQVTLTHVDGLEATYDRAQIYVKAPQQVGLWGDRGTTLHLRLPGATESASLALLPRNMEARVDILPVMARWPRDKVVVRIHLPARATGPAPAEVTPSVTVNSRAVDVEWVRTDQSLETVLAAPPSYPGPWVVRAQVVDQNGITLGRNFLEIASTAGLEDEDLPREVHRVPLNGRATR
jgi:hypothetical protein